MNYLSAEEIKKINQIVVELSGGSAGVREVGMLDSIVVKPQASLYSQEMYPDIFLKAAVLYESIVNYHVFIDGNKRTGWACLARFLFINDYNIKVSDQEIEDYTIFVATKNPDFAEIAQWIKTHSKKTH